MMAPRQCACLYPPSRCVDAIARKGIEVVHAQVSMENIELVVKDFKPYDPPSQDLNSFPSNRYDVLPLIFARRFLFTD